MVPKLSQLIHRYKNKIIEAQPGLLRLVYQIPSIDFKSIFRDEVDIDAPILDEICLPPYFGPTDHDDFSPLMKIVKSLQPTVVLELGTAHGNLTANICHQCPTSRVYTVNAPLEKQTGVQITYELTEQEIGRVYRSLGFSDRVIQIYENTLNLDLSHYFNNPIVDLAIIDACHDSKFVVNDFLKVCPFIRNGGIILLHDTHPSMEGHLRGSYVACALLRQRGYDIRHIQNTWWGIWMNVARDENNYSFNTR